MDLFKWESEVRSCTRCGMGHTKQKKKFSLDENSPIYMIPYQPPWKLKYNTDTNESTRFIFILTKTHSYTVIIRSPCYFYSLEYIIIKDIEFIKNKRKYENISKEIQRLKNKKEYNIRKNNYRPIKDEKNYLMYMRFLYNSLCHFIISQERDDLLVKDKVVKSSFNFEKANYIYKNPKDLYDIFEQIVPFNLNHNYKEERVVSCVRNMIEAFRLLNCYMPKEMAYITLEFLSIL